MKSNYVRGVSCGLTGDPNTFKHEGIRIRGGPDVQIIRATGYEPQIEVCVFHYHRRGTSTIICLEGSGFVTVVAVSRGKMRGKKKVVPLSPGEVVKVPPMVAHSLIITCKSTFVIVGVPGSTEKRPDCYSTSGEKPSRPIPASRCLYHR